MAADEVRVLAHDLRNLLTAARGHAELALLDIEPGDPAREDVARVVVVTSAALAFVERLLPDPHRQVQGPTDLDATVRDLAPLVRALVRQDVDVETRLVSGGHVALSALQLEQVVLNLVINASDAMPRGGRLLILSEPDGHEHLNLEVRDTGPGFSADALAHLFEEGFSTKRPGRGSGLGLAGCRRIVGVAGGSLTVESPAGGGACVRVTLPRVALEPPGPHDDPLPGSGELTA